MDLTLAVLMASAPGSQITPTSVDKALASQTTFALTAETFETVRADLERAHLIDDEDRLTPLADNYAAMWRRFLAKSKPPG
jgi:hypothetical protein